MTRNLFLGSFSPHMRDLLDEGEIHTGLLPPLNSSKGRIDFDYSLFLVAEFVIWDFAFRKIDQRSSEWLFEVVDVRYANRSVILNSNRAMEDWTWGSPA